ncbi:hypothetical protein [Streptacidiphilus anmyonensis]|uniref:hypothetical protein n=1 Tax=Streptacidiphilus anmyonensis TaxID=405782 RepID=UPI000693AA8A|nr:hypothetical protein [Streptacidiphilus anmyonensis]
MADNLIRTQDLVQVTIAPPCVVPLLSAPAPLIGSSRKVTVNGSPACLLGDELPPTLKAPLPYTSPPYATPGTGRLQLVLAPSNLTRTTLNGKPMLLQGALFQALFTVVQPATMPSPAGPVPDPLPTKPGTARFITTNLTVKGA